VRVCGRVALCLGFAAEDRCRDQGNEQAHRQRFHEGVGNVDKRVLVELLGVLDSSDLRGRRSGVEAGRLDFVDLCGELAVHEVRFMAFSAHTASRPFLSLTPAGSRASSR
jgi:hypothetical protein